MELIKHQPTNYNWIIQCDFDGTISTSDVTDTLLEKFGRSGWVEIEQNWEAGKIGSNECMKGQISLLDMTPIQFEKHLETIKIDPYFAEFIRNCSMIGFPVHIVSDGLDWAIRSILVRNGLGNLPVYANHLIYEGRKQWKLETNWFYEGCVKSSANCKCQLLSDKRKEGRKILYIGDGSSDFCVSNKADLVIAKYRLADYCTENKIPFYSFDNFSEVLGIFQSYISGKHQVAIV